MSLINTNFIKTKKAVRLHTNYCYFIIETSYDNKIYVGYAGNCDADYNIKRIVWQAFSTAKSATAHRAISKGFADAIAASEYITVDIVKAKYPGPIYEGTAPNLHIVCGDQVEHYREYYGLIDKYKSYAPYGHNEIKSSNKSKIEKQVIEEYAQKWQVQAYTKRINANTRPVYQYEYIPGSDDTYRLVAEYKSIAHFISTNNEGIVNPSSIYRCCNKKLRTAYGYVWRFNKDEEIIKLNKDKRCYNSRPRKYNRATPEEREQKWLNFLATSKEQLEREEQQEERKKERIKQRAAKALEKRQKETLKRDQNDIFAEAIEKQKALKPQANELSINNEALDELW